MKNSKSLITIAYVAFLVIALAGCDKKNKIEYEAVIEDRLINKMSQQPDSAEYYINDYLTKDSISPEHAEYMHAFNHYYYNKDKKEAIQILDSINTYFGKHKPKGKEEELFYPDLLMLTANTYYSLGYFPQAMHYADKASKELKAFNGDNPFIASNMECMIGHIMFLMGREKEGIEITDKAVKFTGESKRFNAFQSHLNCLSYKISLLYDCDSCESIVKICDKVINEIQPSKLNSLTDIPQYSNDEQNQKRFIDYYSGMYEAYKSVAYAKLGQMDSARTHLQKSLSTEWGKKHEYISNPLIRTYALLGMAEKVDSAYDLYISSCEGDTITKKTINILECKKIIAEKNKNQAEMFEYAERISALHVLLYKKDIAEQIVLSATMYELSQKAKEDTEIERLKKFVWITHAIILAIIIIVLIHLYYHRKKNKQLKAAYQALLEKQTLIDTNIKLVSTVTSTTPDPVSVLFDRIIQEMKTTRPYLKEDFTINTLAKQLNTNVNYISRAISYGSYKTFPQWLAEYRNQIAIKALQNNPNLTINEVCILTGHNTRETFSRQFKTLNGISFSEFKEQNKKTQLS